MNHCSVGEREHAQWKDIFMRAFGATIALYLITEIPYLIGYLKAPEGFVFSGQLAFFDDQNSYFSFIRQAANGHLLFINRLTYHQHAPLLFNLEWLVMGKIMALFRYSTFWTYELWRFLGIFVLVSGFFSLAEVTLRSRALRRIAFLLCMLGGGFGWFFYVLIRLDLIDMNIWATFDQWTTAHPFSQILLNPHHALSLGLFCFIFAFYIKGETSGKFSHYCVAGLFGLCISAIRPYDMIALYLIVLFYILLALILKDRVSFHRMLLRVLPLLIPIPLIMYYGYLFFTDPVYKEFGSKVRLETPPVLWSVLNTGLAGVFCIIRFRFIKQFPLDCSKRLLAGWVVSVFLLTQADRVVAFIPYPLQFFSLLMPPIVLLGVSLFEDTSWTSQMKSLVPQIFAIVLLIVLNSVSSVLVVQHALDRLHNNKNCYVPVSLMESFEWLRTYSGAGDIVLSSLEAGNLLGKYTDAKVALGHPALTPDIGMMQYHATRFFQGEMSVSEAEKYLDYLGIRWIYIEENEGTIGEDYVAALTGLRKCFDNRSVVIYATKLNKVTCSP